MRCGNTPLRPLPSRGLHGPSMARQAGFVNERASSLTAVIAFDLICCHALLVSASWQ